MWWNVLVSLIILLAGIAEGQRDCSRHDYDRCIAIADPLIKEAHLVFPDNLEDIDLVCATWNKFVDCLKVYTQNCFTAQQRRDFNAAVETPIQSVHNMCMVPAYQKEYLHYAPCIKSTIIERGHCGLHYNLLVDQVEQGDIISKSTLCCSYDRFKQCIIRETRRFCDRGITNGPASGFASEIMDKALKFLKEECFNYIPNSGDCVSLPDMTISYSDRPDLPSIISTASSYAHPWSTSRQDMGGREMGGGSSSRMPKLYTSSPWTPSTLLPPSAYPTRNEPPTRSASHGRSRQWDTTSNTSPMAPGSTTRDYSDATRAWNVQSGLKTRVDGDKVISEVPSPTTPHVNLWNPSTVTTTWYPAAGNQLSNEVDEPNQMGLSKPENNSWTWRSHWALIQTLTFCLGALKLLESV